MTTWQMVHADCLDAMAAMPADSVDAIVTDPPYGLAFMGKHWDHGVPGADFWREALRVAKPGAHLIAFGGGRTYHRLACAIEDAGWEVRDCVYWAFGSGFPKSLDVSKAIDKAAGAEREVVGRRSDGRYSSPMAVSGRSGGIMGQVVERLPPPITAPATPAAQQWSGWGTALKPAIEPAIMARKPLVGTVAANVLAWGTGAINVGACRVPAGAGDYDHPGNDLPHTRRGREGWRMPDQQAPPNPAGRWPAHLIHDGSEEVVGLFPQTTSGKMRSAHTTARRSVYGQNAAGGYVTSETYGDSGSAARFFQACPPDADDLAEARRLFYCAKASRADRNEGCEGLEERGYQVSVIQTPGVGLAGESLGGKQLSRARNHHPTVKPTALMRYLCRLVTPPGGLVLDPFAGSGSTGKGALLEGFRFIGIEREAEYVAIAEARLAHAEEQAAASAIGSALISLGTRILPQAPELDAAARARILERLRYRSSLFALGDYRNGHRRPPSTPL